MNSWIICRVTSCWKQNNTHKNNNFFIKAIWKNMGKLNRKSVLWRSRDFWNYKWIYAAIWNTYVLLARVRHIFCIFLDIFMSQIWSKCGNLQNEKKTNLYNYIMQKIRRLFFFKLKSYRIPCVSKMKIDTYFFGYE